MAWRERLLYFDESGVALPVYSGGMQFILFLAERGVMARTNPKMSCGFLTSPAGASVVPTIATSLPVPMGLTLWWCAKKKLTGRENAKGPTEGPDRTRGGRCQEERSQSEATHKQTRKTHRTKEGDTNNTHQRPSHTRNTTGQPREKRPNQTTTNAPHTRRPG